MSTNSQLLALSNALRCAVAGKSEPRRIAAAKRVVAALAPLLPQRGGNRRGPKIRHNRDWAMSRLVQMMIDDPDGLPQKQTELVERLRIAFEMRGSAMPGDTWLRDTVREFYGQAEAQDRELVEKFRRSPDLLSLFQSENDFIKFTRIRNRLEERWWREKALRERFLTASDYVVSMTNSSTEKLAKTDPELANNSDRLSQKSSVPMIQGN